MGNRVIPRIRFHEFDNIWTKSKLGEIYEVYSGNTPSRSDNRNYQNGEIPWIKTTDLNNSIIFTNEEKISLYGAKKLRILPKNSVLIAMYGGFNQIGRTGLLAYSATINQALAALLPVNEINPNFLLSFLNFKKESWRNVAASSRKDPNITKNDVEKFIISFPSLAEQSAIGSLFRTLDDLLVSYKDNLANYQALKATMLSKMFPKAGQTVPEIRLDGFEGEWVEKRLKDISKRVTRKNNDLVSERALTISAQFGLIDQEEFFQKKIASKDVSGYYLIKKGEFAYNKSYSTGYPLGAIKRLDKYENGVLSTLYILFKAVDVDSDYLAHYYESDKWHREVSMCAAEGARNHGLLNIAPADFFNTRLVVPKELEEQRAIGSYFSNLDNLINSHQEKITQLETLKKKLLQDMFI